MLYATTRSAVDTFTAQRVLRDGRGPDGGLFVPFRLPVFTEAEILGLGEKNFNTCAAEILNLLFSTRMTGYDIDLGLGKQPVRLVRLNQRVLIGECWHNLHGEYAAMVRRLTAMLRREPECHETEGSWQEVAVGIAVLFGIFGELIRCGLADGEKKVDVALAAGDFSGVMAAWYSRGMGLPIGNIVCCCNANGNLWDFVCHGTLRTDGIARQTVVSEGDCVVPVGLERLVYAAGGPEETERYVSCLRQGKTYYAEDRFLRKLQQGLCVTVSSDRRITRTIPNVLATHDYRLSAGGALVYGGLQDYRARTGESRTALVMTWRDPRREDGKRS